MTTAISDIFTTDVSDETLERSSGTSTAAQAAASLYSTYDASGCTC